MYGYRFGQCAIVALGLVAVALSVIVDDHEALATMFGFVGVATAVFGLVLPLLDDEFEISPKGLKGKIRRAQLVLENDALTLEEKGDSLGQLLLPGTTSNTGPIGKDIIAIPSFERPEAPQPGSSWVGHIGRDFEEHVRLAFEAEGWAVTRRPLHHFGDFVAERDSAVYIVEVKAARHLSAADVAAIINRINEDGDDTTRWVLVAPEGALSAAALRLVLDTSRLGFVSVPVVEPPPTGNN